MAESAPDDPRRPGAGRGDDPAAAAARDTFRLWNEQGLEAYAERYWHPEIVWEEAPAFPEAGLQRGREQCVSRMEERFAALGHVEIVPTEVRIIEGLVFIDAVLRGRGVASGAPTQMRAYYVSELSGTQVIHLREFLDREQALAAAGAPGESG